MRADDYTRLADAVAVRIRSGRLRPGDRLPTQRAYARAQRIAPSTAARVYAELTRRGLVVGEVGRGTFVRAIPAPSGEALTQPAARPEESPKVNLELNYPAVPGQSAALSASIASLLRPDVLTSALEPVSPRGTEAARRAAAAWLFTPPGGEAPDQGRVLFAGNGRQAIAAALTCVAPPGGRVGVEELTYPLVKEIAERLGRVLVPLAMDAHGVRPEAVRAAAPAALYLQPTLHNPTGVTVPPQRMRELVAVTRELRIPVIEDRVWSFLRKPGQTPFLAYAPERTYVVESLSKRLAPGLTLGPMLVPEGRADWVNEALRGGGWSAGRLSVEAATRWFADGTVARLSAAKRVDAAARQALVAEILTDVGFEVRADPHSYYAWWDLPRPWRAEAFVARAAARGVAITPGASFAVAPSTEPRAVRLGLASPSLPELRRVLRVLAVTAYEGLSP